MNDIFFSYAREDKAIAREIAQKIHENGFSVWLDVLSLKIGDSVTAELGHAINNSKYGVLLISKDYLSKQWTIAELKLLFQKQMASGQKTILPIWHGISLVDIQEIFPFLMDIQALSTSNMSTSQIVSEIIVVIGQVGGTMIRESKIEKSEHPIPDKHTQLKVLQPDVPKNLERTVFTKSLKKTVRNTG